MEVEKGLVPFIRRWNYLSHSWNLAVLPQITRGKADLQVQVRVLIAEADNHLPHQAERRMVQAQTVKMKTNKYKMRWGEKSLKWQDSSMGANSFRKSLLKLHLAL
jgi:hypothetical protein